MKIDNYSLVNVLDLLFKSKVYLGHCAHQLLQKPRTLDYFCRCFENITRMERDESKYGEIGLQDQDGDAITFDDFKNSFTIITRCFWKKSE